MCLAKAPRPGRYPAIPALILALLSAPALIAQSRQSIPPSEDLEGSPLYHVLPKDQIQAIFQPEFVSGAEADAQMTPEEPILGVFDGRNARAYSIWQLDHHEVVDDRLGDVPIAVTW